MGSRKFTPITKDSLEKVTFANQVQVPKLPIPTLEDTLAKYLTHVKPLLTKEEWDRTSEVVKAFGEGKGKVLHADLIEYARDKDSYIENFWTEAYLKPRMPVNINVNPIFVLEDDPSPHRHEQVFRATSLIYSSVRLASAIRFESLAPDMWRTRPLCMSQFKKIFGSARIPGETIDEHKVFPNAQHVVVICRNQFYFFDCLTHEGYVGITQEEISANLTNIIRDAAGVSKEVRADVAVGALTAEERSKWYEARQHMMKIDPENIQILNMIDSALFVVCLDDVSPETESKVAANMLHGLQRFDDGIQVGTCTNRWFDKLQLIVCENGAAGVNFEHSAVDGHSVLRVVSDVFADTIMHFAESITNTMHSKGFLRGMFKLPADPNLKASREHMSLMPKRLELTMNAELKQAVYSAETHLGDDISGTDTEVLEFERYGKTMITSAEMGFSPDAFVQVCMISSYYKLYGEGPNTYEPVQTKTFLHGRTAAMRSLSMHIIEFADLYRKFNFSRDERVGRLKERIRDKEQEGLHTMLSVEERQKLASNKELLRSELKALNVVKEKIRSKFREACNHHIANIKECAKGYDVDRHLYALSCLHEKAGRKLSDGTINAPEIKAMFRDTAWTKLNHTVLSTSNCGNPSLRLFGFGPVVREGYGIGYIIKADSLNFCVTSKHRQTKRFVDTLRRTLLDMERT